MRKADAGNLPMSLVKWIFIGLFVLPAAEVLVLILVAALIGWRWTAMFFVATSLAGVLLLKRSGGADRNRWRAAVALTASGRRFWRAPASPLGSAESF
jgi:UPF0716 family protein affecting phage T7 exclusion